MSKSLEAFHRGLRKSINVLNGLLGVFIVRNPKIRK